MGASFNSGTPDVFEASVGRLDYKTQNYQVSAEFIASLNSGSFYRANPKTNVYVLAGYSLNAARVLYKTPGGTLPGGYGIFYGVGEPNSIRGTITTFGGEVVNERKPYTLFSGLNLGAGISFKMSTKVNIGLEHKYTFTVPGYDFLDGSRVGNSNDYIGLTSFRINVNIGRVEKRVEPLWWLNPHNFVYSELSSPQHLKLPKPVLVDTDDDGITDQFDLEPNTPAGAPVDARGRSKDTDGDGVPDFKDKELLTPQQCFPVNGDGIGSCPEPACCKEMKDLVANMKPVSKSVECTIGSLPAIVFNGNAKLTKEAEQTLTAIAAKLNANPSCNINVIGYGASSKSAQQLSWDRVNAVIKYLVEKQGIAEGRFIFTYGQDGDNNTVDLQGTVSTGPNTVPAPHPNLKKN